MSDDLKKLQEAMTAVRGHLQHLQAEQSATTRELGGTTRELGAVVETVAIMQTSVHNLQASVQSLQASVQNLQARSVHVEATMTALGGTFASIEQILGNLLADHERLEELQINDKDIVRRVEALEQKAG